MSGPARRRLPARRASLTQPIEAGDIAAYATIGFDPETGKPAELFLRPRAGARVGSATDHLVDDVAVVISVALQHGVSARALARSMGRLPVAPEGARNQDAPGLRPPATIIGAALDLLGEASA